MNIELQLKWEKEMIQRGKDRWDAIRNSAVSRNDTAGTVSGSTLMKQYIAQISDGLAEYLNSPGKKTKYSGVLRNFDPDVLAFIGFKAAINCLYMVNVSVVSVASEIGRKIEDQFRLVKFEAEHPAYYEEIKRRMERRKNASYDYKRGSIYGSFRRQKNEQIEYWPTEACIKVGVTVLQRVIECTDLFEIKRGRRGGDQPSMLLPSASCKEWVDKHDEVMRYLFPDRMPCVIPPADWEDAVNGGYYSAELRGTTPFVIRGRYPSTKKLKRYLDADFPEVFRCANIMQNTAWTVNERVFQVMEEVWVRNLQVGMPASKKYEFPPAPIAKTDKPADLTGAKKEAFDLWKAQTRALHAQESKRQAEIISIGRTIKMAREMKNHAAFWYVYRVDFRGRFYAATTGLSPQGNDHGKALLLFHKGKPLGRNGMRWLKIHGAGKYGIDKVSADAQEKWIEDRTEQWLSVASDPIGNRSIWASADKPYQFLAFCFEYADALAIGETYRSRLPIARDGSCNGLQHLSAMLRDRVGGSAVNLTPSETPRDIYSDVAGLLTTKLAHEVRAKSNLAVASANWLGLFKRLGYTGAPRKLLKPPVMTKPYSSTRQTCTETTYEWYKDQDVKYFTEKEEFRHAILITPLIWAAISETAVAAEAAMKTLQSWARKISKHGPISYKSPLGFPVYHDDRKMDSKLIDTQIYGGMKLVFWQPMDVINKYAAANGVVPNLVHNTDSTHLVLTVVDCYERGVTSFAMIHDDFGTHACDVDILDECIRRQFIRLYTEWDPIEDFKVSHEKLYNIDLGESPPRGSLDISAVKDSVYFFF